MGAIEWMLSLMNPIKQLQESYVATMVCDLVCPWSAVYESNENPAVCSIEASCRHISYASRNNLETHGDFGNCMDLPKVIICPVAQISRAMVFWVNDSTSSFEHLSGCEA